MDNNFFYCYSLQLLRFLKLQGISYIYKSKHKKTGNTFWVFNRDAALDKSLEAWESYKKYFWKEKE